MNWEQFEKTFEIDLRNLDILVSHAANLLKYGTRSERRADLGKIVKCPYCKRRKPQNEECCTPEFSKEVPMIGKKVLRRLKLQKGL